MSQPRAIQELVARIRPILTGREPSVQSAVIADLLAIWLAGHFVPGNPAATRDLRASLQREMLLLVDQLMPLNAKLLGTPA